MNFSVDKRIFTMYPDLVLGVLLIKNADNHKKPKVVHVLRSAEAKVRERAELEDVKQHPAIDAWRQAHRVFGNNPNRYAPSVEAVIKRVVKGGQLPDINPLVNLYNAICLTHIVPVGGEDLDTCKGTIELTLATGNEPFIGLGDEHNDSPQPGEVIYKDEISVLCRRFNWREGDRTKLTEKTKNAVIVIEGLPPKQAQDITQATAELEAFVKKFCQAETKTYILAQDNSHPIELAE